MRRFLTLRWLGLHAAMVVIFAAFLGLGWWQLHRAEGGNPLSWGYTFEWPLFAGFVVVFWVKIMRDELREARQAQAGTEGGTEAGTGGAGGEAAGEAGQTAHTSERLTLPAGARRSERDQAGPPFPVEEQDDELAAYNAYLAQLNAEAGRKDGWLSGRGVRRHAAAWRTRPEPPSAPPAGDLEV